MKKHNCSFKTETDLAKKINEYLVDLGWNIYQEIRIYGGGKIADIVAEMNGITWVVECKLSVGSSVVEQAHYWQRHANYVSVGVTYAPTSEVLNYYIRQHGIGVLVANDVITKEIIKPRLNRHCGKTLSKMITPEQRLFNGNAGCKNGDRWSPFRQTCSNIYKYVLSNPECSMKQLLDGIEHSYANKDSARSAIVHWAKLGKIPHIKIEYRGCKIYLKVVED